MKISRHALTVLTRQYRSVLLKCALINAGLFLAVAPAMAAEGDISIAPGGAVTGTNTGPDSISISTSDMATQTWVGSQGYQTASDVSTAIAGKQDKLTNADNGSSSIQVSSTGVISVATGGITAAMLDGNSVTSGAIKDGEVTKAKLATAVQGSLDRADSALQAADIATGTTNGTIKVGSTDIAVKGLGTAAYAAATDFQAAITSTNMLDADLVDDSTSAHKFVTAAEKTQITTNATNIATLQGNVTTLQGDVVMAAPAQSSAVYAAGAKVNAAVAAIDVALKADETRLTTAEGEITKLTAGTDAGVLKVLEAHIGDNGLASAGVIKTTGTANIEAGGDLIAGGNISTTNGTISGKTGSFSGDLGVTGTTTTGTLSVTNNASVGGNATVNGIFGVGTGSAMFVVDASGNITKAGTVAAKGLTTTDSTVVIGGTGYTTTVDGNEVVTGTLKVGGTTGPTLTGSATALSVDKDLKVGTAGSEKFTVTAATGAVSAAGGKFQVDDNGTIQDVRGIYVGNGNTDGAPKVGLTVTNSGTDSVLHISDDTVITGTFGAGATGAEFTVGTDGAVATASTLTADGESKLGKIGSTTTYALDVVSGADAAHSTVTANAVIEATQGVRFGVAAGTDPETNPVMTSVNHGTAIAAMDTSDTTTTTGNDVVASAQAVAKTRDAINAELNAQLGDIFTVNSDRSLKYKDAALAGNGFETGATTLADELTKYAENVVNATGVAFATDGTPTTAYVVKTATDTADYSNVTAGTSLKAAIDKLDQNIGLAMTATGASRETTAFQTAATNTVNQNLSALDAAIGVDMTSAGRTTVGVTAAGNSVNANLTAIDAYLGGDVSGVSRTTGAISNQTVKANLEALDAAIGADSWTDGSSVSHGLDSIVARTSVAANNGVATTNTVNQNIVALNETIGALTNLAKDTGGSTGNAMARRKTDGSLDGDGQPRTVVEALNNVDATLGKIHGLYDGSTVNSSTVTSTVNGHSNLAVGTTVEDHLVSLDNAIGDRSFATTHYIAPHDDLSTAVTKLDSELHTLNHDVRKLRHDMDRGLASVAALSALIPNARGTGNTTLSVGTGYYNGHSSMALGGAHWFTDNLMVNIGAATSLDRTRNATYRAGVSYSF